jgi:hypothetical protein
MNTVTASGNAMHSADRPNGPWGAVAPGSGRAGTPSGRRGGLDNPEGNVANKEWSDSNRWIIGIASALLVALVMWLSGHRVFPQTPMTVEACPPDKNFPDQSQLSPRERLVANALNEVNGGYNDWENLFRAAKGSSGAISRAEVCCPLSNHYRNQLNAPDLVRAGRTRQIFGAFCR